MMWIRWLDALIAVFAVAWVVLTVAKLILFMMGW